MERRWYIPNTLAPTETEQSPDLNHNPINPDPNHNGKLNLTSPRRGVAGGAK